MSRFGLLAAVVLLGFSSGCQSENVEPASPSQSRDETGQDVESTNLISENASIDSPEPSQQATEQGLTAIQPTVAEWIEQFRFWDIYRRLRNEAMQKTLELSADDEKQIGVMLGKAMELDRHAGALHMMVTNRTRLLASQDIDAFILGAVRNGEVLPADLRSERARVLQLLENTDNVSLGTMLPEVETAIINDVLTDAHLLDLVVALRGRLADLARVRLLEKEQDRLFLYFTSYKLESIARTHRPEANRYHEPPFRDATIREHRKHYDSLGSMNGGKGGTPQAQNELGNSPSGDVPVWKAKQLIELEALATTVEGMRGGPEARLKFPKINVNMSRSDVVESSKQFFDRLIGADKKSLQLAFDKFASRLTKPQLAMVMDPKNPVPVPDKPLGKMTPREDRELDLAINMVKFGQKLRRALEGKLASEDVLKEEKKIEPDGYGFRRTIPKAELLLTQFRTDRIKLRREALDAYTTGLLLKPRSDKQ